MTNLPEPTTERLEPAAPSAGSSPSATGEAMPVEDRMALAIDDVRRCRYVSKLWEAYVSTDNTPARFDLMDMIERALYGSSNP